MRAHHLDPIILIGKEGLKGGTFQIARETLKARELIKIRFNDFKEEKEALIEELCQGVGALHVRTIGHTAILYKEKEKG